LFLAYPETNLDKVFLLSNDGSGTESSIWNFSASVGHGATRASVRSGSGTNGVWSATAAGTQLEDEYAKGTIANGTTQFGFWREVDQAGAVGTAVPTIVRYHVYNDSGDNLIMTLDGTNDAFVVNASETIIGEGTAGLDYPITIDGQSDDCVITYMEDENDLDFGDTDLVTTGSLLAAIEVAPYTAATITVTAAQQYGEFGIYNDTDNMEFDLADCVVGMSYGVKFARSATGTVTIDPDDSDIILLADGSAAGAAGVSITLDIAVAENPFVILSCTESGYWEVTNSRGTVAAGS